MSRPDWRSAADYEPLKGLDAPGFAWEFLRRSATFRRDTALLRYIEAIRPLLAVELDHFGERWGVRYQRRPPTIPGAAVPWLPAALPTIVTLSKAPASISPPSLRLSASMSEILRGRARPQDPVQHVKFQPYAGAEPLAALLPFDLLFEVRAGAALQLWRAVTGRSVGPNLSRLPVDRRRRLTLALRALDGQIDGASHRQIADTFFAASRISDRDWISHDLRDRTGRVVRLGVSMMRGGYKQLLLYPYRRRV